MQPRDIRSIIRHAVRTATRVLLPSPVRRVIAERLRGRVASPLVRRLLAVEGSFTVDMIGTPVRMMHTHRWIEDAVYWDGAERGYEPATLAIWVRAAARSSCILDVGANTGLFALSAQSHQPMARVIAFEPVPEFGATLTRNVALNGFPVVVRQVACSDYEGTATMLIPPALGGNMYAATLDRSHAEAHHPRKLMEVSVDVRRIDCELERLGCGQPDLAKVDAEGVDAAVLRGFGGLLAGVRTLIVEVQGASVADQLELLLPIDRWLRFILIDHLGPRPARSVVEASGHNMLFIVADEAKALGLPFDDPVVAKTYID